MARWDDLLSEAMAIAVEQMIYERNQGYSPAEIINRYRPYTPLAITARATWDDAADVLAHAWMAIPGRERRRAACSATTRPRSATKPPVPNPPPRRRMAHKGDWRSTLATRPCDATHFVSSNGAAVCVKEASFFRSQGGLKETWGKTWVPVIARSIGDARRQGSQLFGIPLSHLYAGEE